MFNTIADNPSPNASELEFSISDSDKMIGVIVIFTTSLDGRFSR